MTNLVKFKVPAWMEMKCSSEPDNFNRMFLVKHGKCLVRQTARESVAMNGTFCSVAGGRQAGQYTLHEPSEAEG